jgi:hypothetical protein
LKATAENKCAAMMAVDDGRSAGVNPIHKKPPLSQRRPLPGYFLRPVDASILKPSPNTD